jgi:virulence factor
MDLPMDRQRLRVALVGLGDIAAKAYLPVLAANPDVEPVLITRNPGRRSELQHAWRVNHVHATVEQALAERVRPDAAFVHAATAGHPTIAATLIEAGVPTFVDKPLALSADEARELVESARANEVSLAVCFNRRFAPAYAEAADWPELDTAVLTKNRVGLPDDPRTVIFDDFVHVVDTLRFLVAPEPDDVHVVARRGNDDTLARIAITLGQEDRLGVGIMDRDSGQTLEVLEAMAPGRARRVTDLVDVVDRTGGVAHRRQPDNWASVSQQRGFVAMIDFLLDSVREGTVLDGADALATHELCEKVLGQVSG